MSANSKDTDGEEFPNQSTLCASCSYGIRQVFIDTEELAQEKKLVFFCHSKRIRADAAAPASIFMLVLECEPYAPKEILVHP